MFGQNKLADDFSSSKLSQDDNEESKNIWPNANSTEELNSEEKKEVSLNKDKIKTDELAGINRSAMNELMEGINTAKQADLFDKSTEENQVDEVKPTEETIAPIYSSPAKDEAKKPTDNFFSQAEETTPIDNLATSDEIISLAKTKVDLLKKLVKNIQENAKRVEELLTGANEEDVRLKLSEFNEEQQVGEELLDDKIIEGVFNGQCMIGPDGKQYNIPVNYASKSKLIEGDILKLTISNNGRFIYKQIGPIERIRIVGQLMPGLNNNEFFVQAEDSRRWRVLGASVTYFKGQIDDEVVILVPKSGESSWAAVENIVSQNT